MSSALKVIFIIFIVLTFSQVRGQYKYRFLDPDLPWNDRVDDLVGRLTLQEMVNQTMTGINGIDRLGIKPYVWSRECLRGHVGQFATAFPQSLGLAATFRYTSFLSIHK